MQAARSRTWTKEADCAIVDLVAEYGAKHWSQIAAHVPGRSGKQCRERSALLSDPLWFKHILSSQVAASSKSRNQKGDVVRGGRHDSDSSSQNLRESLGPDSETFTRQVLILERRHAFSCTLLKHLLFRACRHRKYDRDKRAQRIEPCSRHYASNHCMIISLSLLTISLHSDCVRTISLHSDYVATQNGQRD